MYPVPIRAQWLAESLFERGYRKDLCRNRRDIEHGHVGSQPIAVPGQALRRGTLNRKGEADLLPFFDTRHIWTTAA